jgi:gliding motility-associated-like protein
VGNTQFVDSLLEGMYFVTVSDSAGCIAVDSAFVSSAPNELYLAGRVPGFKAEETCYGYSYDGYVGYEIRGGSGPYVFNWINSDSSRTGSYTAYAQYCDTCISSDGITSIDSVYMLDSLTTDIYKVTLIDANGCYVDSIWFPIDSISITALNINNPLSIDKILGSDILCYGASNGYIEFYMNDSIMLPLIYELDSNSSNSLINSTGFFSSLSANTYNVLITDSFGCFIDTSYTIVELNEIDVTANADSLSCYESDDGEISISFTGGIAPFTFDWLGPNTSLTQNSNVRFSNITNLTIGTYFLRIKDENECLAFDTITVSQPDPLLSTIVQTTDASCNGYADASGSISVSGGTSPYQYSWTDSITGAIISTTDSISDVAAGTYVAFITDANGCQDAIEVIFEEPTPVFLQVVNIDSNLCAGDSLGSITLSASGGTQPYVEYYINASSGSFNDSGSDYIFDSLITGNYDLWVIDANGCSSNTIIEEKIGEPGQIELTSTITSLSCFESNDGNINLNFSGGVAPYNYQLSNMTNGIVFNQSDPLIIENLPIGFYHFNVTDYNNCTDSISVTVDQPDLVFADFSIDENLILEENTVTVTNLSSGANNFSWNFGDNSNNSNDFELTYKYYNQGNFIIELIASNDNLSEICNDTTWLDIDVEGYDVNNVFSPNNDGINDEYHFGDEMLIELRVTIYNRWGQQIYAFDDVKGSWDGKSFNGELMPEGVYFFIMEALGSLGDSYIEEGTITLLR